MTPFSRIRLLALAAVCACLPTPSAAQPSSRTVTVRGTVVDDAGAPIAGATIEISNETSRRRGPLTDEQGAFVVTVPRASSVRLVASHPDYGLQHTDMLFDGWSRYDVPAETVQLTLRRGVVLRGQLVDASGAPLAHETLLLVFDYRGSGPFPLQTTTDRAGQFTFPRAVLSGFELVAHEIRNWHPETGTRPGTHLRVVEHQGEWLARARLDQPVTVTVEPFTLALVTVAVTSAGGGAVTDAEVDLWVRRSPEDYVGTMPRTDARGRCTTLMEPGVAYELWVDRNRGARTAPWTQSIAPRWRGSIEADTTLTLTIP